nr:reverse transcriptase domain-containing protein [Tanacetum cinerariifolium]
MTLELADRSISRSVGVTEDVFVKVGTFYFHADYVVVDFDADPRVLLILGRSFLKTGRALIDIYEGELALRVGKEAVTFNLDQTSRYSANYDAMSVNRIDLSTSTKGVQPLVVQIDYQIPNSEPIIAPVAEPVVAHVSAPKPNQKPSIPYPSKLHDQKLRDNTNDQKEKIFKIFKDSDFNISFVDALILMPKFGPTIKSLLTNKEKLYKLARTLLNEHCLAVLLKKLPERTPASFSSRVTFREWMSA